MSGEREALRERLTEALRAGVIDWNTTLVKNRHDVSAHLADALLPVVVAEKAAAVKAALSPHDQRVMDAVWDALDEHGHNGIDCRPAKPMDCTVEHALRSLAALADDREGGEQ